jgi:hypothetical protein
MGALAKGRFTGETPLRSADGSAVNVQWAATVEVVTRAQLVAKALGVGLIFK